MLSQLEKRISKNQEMRIKYPDHPEKFMESEIELNDAKFVLEIDEPFDDMGTSSKIGRLTRLGYPATIVNVASVVRLFVELLADETEGLAGCER
ncbi:unnamed protein product [Rotaria sp. Silwood2]|nr:unnamed protein product [Rotaria sp. Silwood2]